MSSAASENATSYRVAGRHGESSGQVIMRFDRGRFSFGFCGLLFLVYHCAAQTLVVTPPRLTFRTTADSTTLPPSQTIQITSPNGNVPFSIGVAGGGIPAYPVFLFVTPTSGTTPATVTVNPLPIILSWPYGSLYDHIGIGSGPTVVDVIADLIIDLPPPPIVKAVLNAATFQPGISPGAIIAIFGEGIGPSYSLVGISYGRDSGHRYYPLLLDTTKVTFNGVAAPLLYAGSGQINAVVPYEVAGQSSVDVVVTHYVAAPAVTLPVLDTSPGIFTVPATGSGQGAILNQDGTLNGTQNPAPAGSVIQIIATGAGLWNPSVPDGLELPMVPPWPVPFAAVSIAIGGQPAEVRYMGGASGLISGLLQVNAVIPDGLASGSQPVLLMIGNNSNSHQQVTVAVQ